MQAVFEPYFSLENVNHHSTGRYKFMGGGIGLGLTVSRLIMEYHGGGLTVDSPGENRGTNVTLRFPLDGTPAPEA
jgi:signal transduction histidine kinase